MDYTEPLWASSALLLIDVQQDFLSQTEAQTKRSEHDEAGSTRPKTAQGDQIQRLA